MATGRIYEDDFVLRGLDELRDATLCHSYRIGFRVGSIKGNVKLGGILFQLVQGTGSEGIGTDHGRFPMAFGIVGRHFRDRCGFVSTLQTHKEDNVGFSPAHDVGLLLCVLRCRGRWGS